MRITRARPPGADPARRAASVALLLAVAAVAVAGCGTAAGPAAPAAPAAPVPGSAGRAPAAATPSEAPAPDVSEEPLPASERAAALHRVAAALERGGADPARHAAAARELERYLAARPRERDDAVFALVARLLAECQRLHGDLDNAVRERNELRTLLQRLRDLEMQMEEKRKRMR